MFDTPKLIYALGIGRSTCVLTDLAEACGYHVAALYHYDGSRTGEQVHDWRIVGSFYDLFRESLVGRVFLLTMGDMRIREQLARRIIAGGGMVPSLVHPQANVSRYAVIAPAGVYVHALSTVQADAVVGAGTEVAPAAVVCHTVRLGRYCYVASGAVVGAYTDVADHVFVGLNATLISSKAAMVGEGATIGASAVVTRSVPPQTVVAGNPARILKARD